MTAIRGPEAYDEMVNKVNTLLPRGYFYGLELAVVIGPLLFHSLYGIYVASTGQPNVGAYPYGSNWAYWMQRISGYVAFVYILIHVGVLRVAVTFLGHHLAPYAGTAPGKLDLVTYNDVAAHLGNPDHIAVPTWMAGNHIFVIYVIGTLVTIYHFTNGLNGFAWTWGIAVGRVAQKRVKVFSWILFVILGAVTLNILLKIRFSGTA
jgi:succinate dehydrogenase/fumarate reductase cytochrome b subunit